MRPRRARRNPALAILANPGRTLSREVHSLAYRHTEDGKAYRHDFEGPVNARLNRDGSVTLRHRDGKRIWDDFPERPYLVNPKQGRTRMARTTKKRSTRARRGKRPPPKGYGSWKAYMAAIRPGAAKPKRARTTKEATMARSKKRRGGKKRHHRASTKKTVVRYVHTKKAASRGRRRYHRNPPGAKGLLKFGVDVVVETGIVVGGRAAARVLPGLLDIDTATDMGKGAQAALAVLAGGGLHYLGKSDLGCKVAAAILSVPAEAKLKELTASSTHPLIANAFGDDQVVLGSYVDPKGLGAYVHPRNGMGSYVPAAAVQQ